ncbi:MAG: sulfatase-like hydrolase/transferase, partial [Holophagales bacterium]|nr:sulfatase-like hydrolase/transferase [Holophagales bacterium]
MLSVKGRGVLALALIAGGAALLASILWRLVAAPWLEVRERRGRPVVLITLDTTRADVLEPYGGPVSTPALAALARRGVVFERAYSVAPITLVAHASLLSGLYPPEHGVRNNGLHEVPEEVDTLAELLAAEGYHTGAFVSASVLERRYGLDQGFHRYDDDLSAGRERHRYMVPDRPAGAAVDSALEWLGSLPVKEPFFLWLHLYDPHAPYSPPEPFRERYADRPYQGEIAYMDTQIARLLEHPKIGPEAVVAVVGDHGESLGEHGEQTHAILAYDSTLHVPFLLQVPGAVTGTRVPAPVSHVDVLPTLLAAVGFASPAELRGRNLLAPAQADSPPPLIYSETYLPYYSYGWSKLKAVRRGLLKYIDAPEPELYDLHADPRELSNQHAHQPGAAHDLARDLAELEAAIGDPERESRHELDADSEEKLRSLGYLSAGTVRESPGGRLDPKHMVHLHTGLERARRLAGDGLWELAERQLRTVLEEDAHNLAALLELAEALGGQGRWDDAVGVMEQALGL